jgi:hypothetical protein
LQSANNGKAKLYFRYDEDGKTITAPLPFHFKTGTTDAVIQGIQRADGQIDIQCNLLNVVKLFVTETNLFGSDTVIAANSIDANIFYYVQQYLEDHDCMLCTIDSADKNAFVHELARENFYYYIDGERSFIDGLFYDRNGNELSYTNWSSGHPLDDTEYGNIAFIDGEWKSVTSTQNMGFVAEYKLKRLTKLFENPRIYYEILGNKEVAQ